MPPYEATLGPKELLALRTLRPILAAAGRPEPDMRNIVITENAIREYSVYDGLTRAILEYDMPEITSTAALDHYTGMNGFDGIMKSQELRLAPVTFRLSQGELATFAWEHGLEGYVDTSGAAKPLLKEAAADLFYTSFSEPIPSDPLWYAFGDNGNGYRLRFEVTPGPAAQLRAIRYHAATTLLKQVNDALTSVGLPRFVLKGVSRVGAFYLPITWKAENETRLLAKRFAGGGAPVVTTGQSEYWPVPIGTPNQTADLALVEIGVRNRDATVVSARLPSWCGGVRVVTD